MKRDLKHSVSLKVMQMVESVRQELVAVQERGEKGKKIPYLQNCYEKIREVWCLTTWKHDVYLR